MLTTREAGVDMFCLMKNCLGEVNACRNDEKCGEMLSCTALCLGNKRCELKCALNCSQDNTAAHNFFSSLKDHGCFLAKTRYKRPSPSKQLPTNSVKLENLLGEGAVIRGLSDIYDCWPGQKMTCTRTSRADKQIYQYVMQVDTNLARVIPCSVRSNQQPAPNAADFITTYRVLDVFDGEDRWHVLHANIDYMLIYYCGGTEGGDPTYQGGIIMARSEVAQKELPAANLDAKSL